MELDRRGNGCRTVTCNRLPKKRVTPCRPPGADLNERSAGETVTRSGEQSAVSTSCSLSKTRNLRDSCSAPWYQAGRPPGAPRSRQGPSGLALPHVSRDPVPVDRPLLVVAANPQVGPRPRPSASARIQGSDSPHRHEAHRHRRGSGLFGVLEITARLAVLSTGLPAVLPCSTSAAPLRGVVFRTPAQFGRTGYLPLNLPC